MSHADHELKTLARQAVEQLLLQRPVAVTHAAGWERNGFPLPIKSMPPSANGSTTQDYRPLAILEYVHESLSGDAAKRRASDRKAEKDSEL